MGKYPIPKHDTEISKPGNSIVTTMAMTPEDYAKFGMSKPQSDMNGREEKQPILNNFSPEARRLRAEKRDPKPEEEIPMPKELTKETYLKLRAAGKLRTVIQKEFFNSPPPFYKQLKLWGLRDKVKEEEAIKQLDTKTEDVPAPVIHESEPKTKQDPEQTEVEVVDCENIPDPKLICIYIPIIDGGWNPADQHKKVDEELVEFTEEFHSELSQSKTATELYDLIQAYAGLIRSELTDLIEPSEVDQQLDRFFSRNNDLHIDKIKRYSVERDWKIIKE